MIYNLRSLGTLPTVIQRTCKDGLSVSSDIIGCTPWVRQGSLGLTRIGIKLHSSETTVPGTIYQPMLSFWSDDVSRVDGIILEIAVCPII